MFELSIQVKDEQTSLTDKEIVYENMTLHREDAALKQRVIAAVGKFVAATSSQAEKIDVVIRTKMIWQ